MRDTLVKSFETGAATIQGNSPENTRVQRKGGLDKSVFPISPTFRYELAFVCHILANTKPLQNNPPHVQDFCVSM